MFQAYDIDSKSLLEALKKLAAYNTLKQNGLETNYSRWLMQYNPNLKGKFNPNVKQKTNKQVTKEDKAMAKEIAEAFSAVTGQEISEEEVGLIQDIQLPGNEVDNQAEDIEASEGKNTEAWLECKYNPDVYFVECVCCDIEHVFNITLGKNMGTTFPVSIQDKEINAFLDAGTEKSCMSMDMFARLKLSINTGRTPKLRNASGRDMKTHGVTTVKFKMGNTIFTQNFMVCDDLFKPIIIGRDFTINNYIGIIWKRQGTKKVMQDDRVVIEVEEPARWKTLMMMRKIAIPPRHYAEFELKCDELEGKFEIRPEPFLQHKEPNLWMDIFVIYNVIYEEDPPTNFPFKDHPEAPLGAEECSVVPPEDKAQCVPPGDPFSRFWSGQTADISDKNKRKHRWLTRKPEHRHSVDTAELERQVPGPHRPKFYSRYPDTSSVSFE